jgi:hypothetical protein
VKHAIFIDIDEKLATRARRRAAALGRTLDQLTLDCIQKLADDDPERCIEEFERLSGTGNSGGWRFDRNEIHERR